jgi:hypothetical protein
MKKPQSIHSILEKTLKTLEIDVPLKTYSIVGAWNEIVGASVAEHSQPRSIRNQILFIDVAHPTWMQQLQFLKPTLLDQVNAFLGGPLIQDIRFKLGKVSAPPPASPKSLLMEDEPLDQGTLDRIENHLKEIDDEEVKMRLRTILINSAKLERTRSKSS